MNISTIFSTKLVALIFTTVLLFAGCTNPASNDDHEEHSDPDAIEFLIDGEVVVSYTHSSETTEGHFDITEGDQTPLITAEFKDEDGNEIHSNDLGDEYSLNWEVANTDIAEVVQSNSDGRWEFRITGKATGETTVQFMLMHGADHSDFETLPTGTENAIRIHVAEQS